MRRPLVATALVLAGIGGGAVTLGSVGAEPCRAQASPNADVEAPIDCGKPPAPLPTGVPGGTAGACVPNARLRSVAVRPRGRGLRVAFTRAGAGPVTAEVFQLSTGRTVRGRRVARLTGRTRSFTLGARRVRARDGIVVVRLRARGAETRRFALRRRGGRYMARPAFERRAACGTIRAFKLERPVFGGPRNRALGIAYRVGVPARVTITVSRRGRVVRRFRTTTDRAGRTYRLRLASERLGRGDHVVRLIARPTGGGAAASAKLTSARL